MSNQPDPSARDSERFSTVLVHRPEFLGWTVAFVPFQPRERWPQLVRLRVAAELKGVSFRTSLFPDASTGRNFLLVNRDVQTRSKTAAGASVEFEVWPDLEPRPALLSDELAAMLDEEPGLRDWYDSLSESMRRELGKWIEQPKQAEARSRRALAAAERLLLTKEAEEQLPPLLVRAFRAQPAAAAGWQLLTPHQRRAELLAVFLYQSPEARERRVAKLCQAAAARKAKG
jgi:uncharacterized protein YdeI (YjbR/CyaY-like superfamily)